MDVHESHDPDLWQADVRACLKEKQSALAHQHFTGNKERLLASKKEEWLREANEYALTRARARAWKHLASCFVLEHTPVGNVILHYDLENGRFHYYSDATIPYRYLETVARKFVKQFCCRPLYVDMETELRLVEEKKAQQQQQVQPQVPSELPVRSVYAKLRHYNQPRKTFAGSAKVPAVQKEQIKARTNVFHCCGKLSQFPMLQMYSIQSKPPLTYEQFKAMQQKQR